MGNYVFLNRSNLSISTDLSAWHVEAIPLLVAWPMSKKGLIKEF